MTTGPGDGPRRRRDPRAARAARASVEDPAVVLAAGLRLLERRARSIAEVRRHLVAAGYQAELVESAIERLSALGILNDTAFGRAWIESRDRAHPRGAAALARELRLKGLDPALIAELLGERRIDARVDAGGVAPGEPEDPDIAAAARLLGRRGRSVAREADPRRRRARAWSLLARHGFAPDVIRAAVLAWDGRSGEPGDVDPGPDDASVRLDGDG